MLQPAKPYAIVTCCDAGCGNFLLEHWLRSLVAHVDLSEIEVVVLDYGLNEPQRGRLAAEGVLVFPCTRDGYVCNVRYRDIVRLLAERPYRQVMSVDAGDVIFQADIAHLFRSKPRVFRAVAEDTRIPFFEGVIRHEDIRPRHLPHMLRFLSDKPMLNCGMLVGPAGLYREFWREYRRLCHDFACFGVDQFAFNYYAYQSGNLATLDSRYNFVLITTAAEYTIENGVFLDSAGRPIPLVHNAGGQAWSRQIDRFGYGPDRNRKKLLGPLLVKGALAGVQVSLLAKGMLPGRKKAA